ncbi:cytochrome c [Pseudomonas sp. MAP12]|uniref:Cytochrome c n=1 Tax=Geopseudomonas aromaticivorans TaxID=2849492 RepID=A0ABS6N0C0_9GAMM|nr:cytochrome c [Pseudomonas aromaticivorans]MBV2134250.1 cytochrome c [Pseudomonas aromaticivorans]
MLNKLIAGTAGLLLTCTAGLAVAQVSPEDQIEYRKAGYSFMAWNMGKIKAQVVEGSVAYDQQQVAAAANAIAAIANSGMGALYGPGTEKSVGKEKTRVKPEFFTQKEEVAKVAIAFNQAANNLAKVAAGGDKAQIAQAFGDVGKSCKGCHDKFRMD